MLAFLFLTAGKSLLAQVPQLINYQGRVVVGSTDFTGTGQFAFALVNTDGSTTYWSNDGTSTAGSQPTNAVSIPVTKGLYSLLLGDSTIAHMTVVPPTVFLNSDVRLRVWFNDGTHGFQKLSPDQRIAAVGYAMVAGSVASGGVTSTQLSSNLSFTGNVTLTNGDLLLPATTDGTAGVIELGGSPFLHAFGVNDTFVGSGAGNFTLTGSNNAAVGKGALGADTTGINNAALGSAALASNTTGFYNTALGYAALNLNDTGSYNTATGFNSMPTNTSGGANTADGIQTLFSNMSGSYNTAMGDSALYYNSSGTDNTAVGDQALFQNTTATGNTAFGSYALNANTSGAIGTAVGYKALMANTSGNGEVAVGDYALFNNTTGDQNTAVGDQALLRNVTGAGNVAVGALSLAVCTGSQNTAVGYTAGGLESTGSDNVCIGYGAGTGLGTGSNNIVIGANNIGQSNESNTISIGGSQTTTFIAGIFGATAGSGVPVYVEGAGILGTMTSSRRFKQNIHPMGNVSDVLLSLHPVTFQYKPSIDPQATPEFGLVAEDVAKVDPDLIVKDKEGQPYTVRYDAVNAMLLNEFQKEHAKVEKEEETVSLQQKEIEELREEMAEVRKQANNRATRH